MSFFWILKYGLSIIGNNDQVEQLKILKHKKNITIFSNILYNYVYVYSLFFSVLMKEKNYYYYYFKMKAKVFFIVNIIIKIRCMSKLKKIVY